MAHKYTSDQVSFLTENVAGCSSAELTEMFNAHFGLDLSLNQINRFLKKGGGEL